MFLLEVENEENAVICLRIIIDLHKNYRPALEGEVQAFLDIVLKIYSELQNTIATTFAVEASGTAVPNHHLCVVCMIWCEREDECVAVCGVSRTRAIVRCYVQCQLEGKWSEKC